MTVGDTGRSAFGKPEDPNLQWLDQEEDDVREKEEAAKAIDATPSSN